MKKLKKLGMAFIFIMAFFLTANIQAQDTYVLKADTISNSMAKTGTGYYVDLDKFVPYDSICFSVYGQGEIDVDSLDVAGGIYKSYLDYLTSGVTSFSIYEALDGATLTINQDSAGTSYQQNAVTITKGEAAGYNRLKITLTAAASGNAATDPGQKFIIFYTVFKSVYKP